MTDQPIYDVAIVGGGIAGTCAAITLARRGVSVILLEAGEFPRHKVCGEFFSGEARPVFARLGLAKRLDSAPTQRVSQARLIAPSGRSVRLAAPTGAFALSRYTLDALLWDAAREAGVDCQSHSRVRRLRRSEHEYRIETTQGAVQAQVVLVAAGRNTPAGLLSASKEDTTAAHEESGQPTRFVGLKAHFKGASLPVGLVEMHGFGDSGTAKNNASIEGGYCGLTRVEGGLTNACLLIRAQALQNRAPEAFFTQILRQQPRLRHRLAGAERVTPWLTTANIRFGQRHPATGEVLLCGDASGYIPPLAGDGMSMAARSGELAASIIFQQLDGKLDEREAAATYRRAWHAEFGTRLRWAEVFQEFGLHRQSAEAAVAFLRLMPPLGRLAVRLTRS